MLRPGAPWLRGRRVRGAHGACVFNGCGQHFLSPLCLFLHLTTILPSPAVSPCAVAVGWGARRGCNGCRGGGQSPRVPRSPLSEWRPVRLPTLFPRLKRQERQEACLEDKRRTGESSGARGGGGGPLGSANAETTPAGAPAAAANRTQRPHATCEGKNG